MIKREVLKRALSVEHYELAVSEIERARGKDFLEMDTYEKASAVLSGSFSWENSRQGGKFWSDIQRDLYRKEDKGD